MRLKTNGHLYWVPAAGSKNVRAFARVVEKLGASELPCIAVVDREDARGDVARRAQASFEHDIGVLLKQLEAFAAKDNVRESTITGRLEELATLHGKARLMKSVLRDRLDAIDARVAEAKARAEQIAVEIRARYDKAEEDLGLDL